MTYTMAEGRQQLLLTLAEVIGDIDSALADLGEAYELLDEGKADQLEEELFRPAQAAYGRAKRTYAEFARRHDMAGVPGRQATRGAPSHGAKGFLTSAGEAIGRADERLGGLQDTMLPIEVGDEELRSGLQEVRLALADLPSRARLLLRSFGR